MVFGGQLVVAFDAAGVSGASVSRRRGRLRVRTWARATLAAGALEPGGVESNLVRQDEVREALSHVVAELGAQGRAACVVLPAGVARTTRLDLPAGVDAAEFALFRLGSRLPYAAAEAVVDGLTAGDGYLAAVVRRSVVAGYEALVAEVGLEQQSIDVTPLAGLAGLRRVWREDRGIDVVLGDAALTLAVRSGGGWSEVRSRRRMRSAPDADRLADSVEAFSRRDVGGGRPRVRLVGPGSDAGADLLRKRGHVVETGWGDIEGPRAAAEAPWLGGVA